MPIEVDNKLTLASIGGGVAAEKFERELSEVLANILDVNTDTDVKREITLKFVFKPNEDRERLNISISADSKLAPTKAHGAMAYLGRVDNEPVAVNFDPRQVGLFDMPQIQIGRAHV